MTWEWLPLVVVRATEVAEPGEPGLRTVRVALFALCILAIAIVAYYTYARRAPLDATGRAVLMVGFLVLSPFAYVMNAGLAISGAKSVSFCASCHVMHGYVEDLRNPDSEHLASMHYQFRWVADHQCYTCHSDYGLFGGVEAKLAGLRHVWFNYVGYETPLKIHKRYDNQRCLFCHGPVKSYQEIPEHEKNAAAIASSEKSCIGGNCHVTPHPKSAAEVDAPTTKNEPAAEIDPALRPEPAHVS